MAIHQTEISTLMHATIYVKRGKFGRGQMLNLDVEPNYCTADVTISTSDLHNSSVIHAHCIYYANISGKVIKHTFLSSVYSCRFQPQSVPWPATATAQTDIAYITWLMRLYSACSDESSQTNPIHNHINNHDVVFALRCLSFTADIDIHKASSPVQTLCWCHSVYPKLLIIFDELP